MNDKANERDTDQAAPGKGAAADRLDIPDGLVEKERCRPSVFVSTEGLALQEADAACVDRVNGALGEALETVHRGPVGGQAVVKVHIGEPKRTTRMNPVYVPSSAGFLRDKGASGVAAGDTTVAYTGLRGHRANPMGDAAKYVELARRHGWSREGPAGMPFVVLDRPCTSAEGEFAFDAAEVLIEVKGIERFSDFYLSGGFAHAGFVVDHAHLTLHGLAGVAGCVKSVAMGCSSLRGKFRMHQSLLPHFDSELCVLCGSCVEQCPEDALAIREGDRVPAVLPERCIGCGECEAVCALRRGAITLKGTQIDDWERGEDTLPMRMADYMVGLMNGRWDDMIHVLHMYTVTGRCDCVDVEQGPLLDRDIGFLVGKNPFALDRLAGAMLRDRLEAAGVAFDASLLESAETSADYAERTYGILAETPVEEITVR